MLDAFSILLFNNHSSAQRKVHIMHTYHKTKVLMPYGIGISIIWDNIRQTPNNYAIYDISNQAYDKGGQWSLCWIKENRKTRITNMKTNIGF